MSSSVQWGRSYTTLFNGTPPSHIIPSRVTVNPFISKNPCLIELGYLTHGKSPFAMCTRVLEVIFFFYFASHIPITLFIDLQALLPEHVYPQPLKDLLHWYATEFKDPMVVEPPVWFKSFILCEALVQLPFFPVATYAFCKGGCKWIRTPAIVYSTHVATTLIPIISYVLLHEFPTTPNPGPQTLGERFTLVSIYAPYLIIPIILLLTMLFNPAYSPALQDREGMKLKSQ